MGRLALWAITSIQTPGLFEELPQHIAKAHESKCRVLTGAYKCLDC